MKLTTTLKTIGKGILASALTLSAWTSSFAQCLNNPNQYPYNVVVPTVIDGTTWNEISSCNYEEEYAEIQTMGGVIHQVKSSLTSTFITVSLDNGVTAVTSGTGTVSFTPTTSGIARVYFNTNNSCGTAQNCIETSYKIGTANVCAAPTNLVVSSLTNIGANIAWTAPSPAPANGYDYYISTSSTIPMANITPTGSSTTTSAVLGSLAMGTNYKVWMRSKCSSTSMGYWNLLDSFTTEVIVPAPWSEGFSGGNLPLGFEQNTSWFVANSPGYLEGNPGEGVFGFSAFGLTPLSTLNINNITAGHIFMLDYKFFDMNNAGPAPSPAIDYFKVFISTNFGQTYTQIDSVSGAVYNSWSYKVYPLNSYVGQTVKFKVEAGSTTSTNAVIALDNFYVGNAPNCFPPSGPTVTNVTNATATINWSAAYQAPANGYEYYYNTTGTAPTASTTVSGSVGPGVLTAPLSTLTSGTTYYVWVRSNCSASSKSTWASGGSFTTETVVARPWIEGFSTFALPNGFNGGFDWFVENDPPYLVGNPAYAIFASTSSWTPKTSFTTLNVSGILATDVLMFDYRHFDGMMAPAPPVAGAGYVKVYVSNNWGQSYTLVDSFSSLGVAAWNEKMYSLSAYAGQTIKIKLEAGNINGDFFTGFDNLYVGAAPTCFKPSNGAISNITHNSATIAWTAPSQLPGNGYEYYYTTSTVAPTSTTTASGNVGAGITTANISGLNSGTTYYVWARSVCSSSDKSLWASLGSFTTQYVTPRPWNEGFLNYDVLPLGFNVTPDYYDYWMVGEEQPYISGNPGNALFALHEYPSTNTVTTINVSGILAGDVLKFDYRYFDANSPQAPLPAPAAGAGSFKVFISTNYGVTYTQIANETTVNNSTWTTKSYPLSNYVGQTVKVKIESTSNIGYLLVGFDNFYIGGCTTASVGSIAVTGTAPSFNFAATGAQNATTYTWIYGDNSPNGTGTSTSHTYNVNGTYTVKLIVSNDCGSDTVEQQVTVTGASVNDLNLTVENLKLYPNPAQNLLKIENLSPYKMKSIVIYNILGQKVLQQNVKNNQIEQVNVAQLSNGMHAIVIEFDEGTSSRKVEIVK